MANKMSGCFKGLACALVTLPTGLAEPVIAVLSSYELTWAVAVKDMEIFDIEKWP